MRSLAWILAFALVVPGVSEAGGRHGAHRNHVHQVAVIEPEPVVPAVPLRLTTVVAAPGVVPRVPVIVPAVVPAAPIALSQFVTALPVVLR